MLFYVYLQSFDPVEFRLFSLPCCVLRSRKTTHIVQKYSGNIFVKSSDVYPDWSYPDPDPDPDPGRIQINKITKFSKHLLIFKSKKKSLSWVRKWPSANISTYFFLGSDFKNINSCEKKIFLLVKLCFPLHFISDFIPLDPDPDPHPRTQMNPDPNGSGSTSLVKSTKS